MLGVRMSLQRAIIRIPRLTDLGYSRQHRTLLCRVQSHAGLLGATGMPSSSAAQLKDIPRWQSDCSPVIPLHERPQASSTSVQQLKAWYQDARQQSIAAAQRFDQPDDPSAADLLRELDWFLEDAVMEDWRMIQGQSQPAAQGNLPLRISLTAIQDLWQKRLESRVPLQYLTNSAHWGNLVIAAGCGVLIPRPETYCLIELAQEVCRERPYLAEGIWADLGTGSGALAIGLADQLPNIQQIIAADLSLEAIHLARFNSERLGWAHKIQVRQGSWFKALSDMRGKLSGIVSNPPYIERHVLPSLQAEVQLHEPREALDGGDGDGLDCLREICEQAADYLVPGGFLGLEMGGAHQTRAVCCFEAIQSAFTHVKTGKDMFGVERFVTAIKK